MPEPDPLHLRPAKSSAPRGACRSPGCPLLPGHVREMCEPAARVHAAVLVLCRRVLGYDPTSFEAAAPGVTLAAYAYLLSKQRRLIAAGVDGPGRSELDAVNYLLAELRALGAAW